MLETDTKKTFWGRLLRLFHLRLIVPIKRSTRPPEFTARGVLVGMMWAMTPLVGVQMTTVFLTWIVAKKLFKWDFSLPVALAWTWVTNVFTMWPVYYIFYATGQVMMGHFDQIGPLSVFVEAGREAFSESVSFWQIGKSVMIFLKVLMKDWGLAMGIGCLPWAIICGTLSYRLTLKWLRFREQSKAKSGEKRAHWRALLHRGDKDADKS